MKKVILFTLLATIVVACSKDDQKSDSTCGVAITQIPRSDGGIQEKVATVACGDAWQALKNSSIPSTLFFEKGVPRSAATYVVATKTDTIYIRYGGNHSQQVVDSFQSIGYAVKVATISGLEHVKWP